MIPTYLNNLVLEKVFASYCSNTDQYILESTSDEHVVDSDAQKISGFVTDSFGQTENETNKFFAVENPNGGRYALLQIDNGIIHTHSTKKCDCIIANASCLCFIEFKANALSDKPSTIEKNYAKAMGQLMNNYRILRCLP